MPALELLIVVLAVAAASWAFMSFRPRKFELLAYFKLGSSSKVSKPFSNSLEVCFGLVWVRGPGHRLHGALELGFRSCQGIGRASLT